jgi:hypothetical protein
MQSAMILLNNKKYYLKSENGIFSREDSKLTQFTVFDIFDSETDSYVGSITATVPPTAFTHWKRDSVIASTEDIINLFLNIIPELKIIVLPEAIEKSSVSIRVELDYAEPSVDEQKGTYYIQARDNILEVINAIVYRGQDKDKVIRLKVMDYLNERYLKDVNDIIVQTTDLIKDLFISQNDLYRNLAFLRKKGLVDYPDIISGGLILYV